MRRTTGSDAELWVKEIDEQFGVPVRLTQEYVRQGIVIPKIPATGGGGRNVFGRVELVKLLIARSLAEGWMPWKEVRKVIEWFDRSHVVMARYTDSPYNFKRHLESVESMIAAIDSSGTDWWKQTLSLDPFPTPVAAEFYYKKTRGYPEQPTSDEEWREYWGSMAQYLHVDRYREKLASLHVLLPLRWLNAEEGRFKGINSWFNNVVGDTAFEPALQTSESPLTTVHILDLARIKKQVADVLLHKPEELSDEERMRRNMGGQMLMATARIGMSMGR